MPLGQFPFWSTLYCIMLTFLALSSHESVRAEWITLNNAEQSPDLRTVYLDPTFSRRSGNLVTVVTLIDWKWMQGNRSPTRFYSTKLTKRFDCSKTRLQRLSYTDYYGHMGTGRVIAAYEGESSWYPVEPESLDHTLWEIACGKE